MSEESNERPPSSEDGISVQVFGEANRGGRKHMEDVVGLEMQKKGLGQLFVAVFDGHGGKEAAHFADKELWPTIRSLEGFETTDSEAVKKAITRGFRETHNKMWSVRESWKNNSQFRCSSTSGTTVSVAIIRKDRMFIANVGDSTVVLAVDSTFNDEEIGDRASNSSSCEVRGQVRAIVLTDDHKPESRKEMQRIEKIGGKVLKSSQGVMRVAWLRKTASNTFSTSNPTQRYDVVPFLGIARSLGDLWSYTDEHDDYFVSPVPDVQEYKFNINRDRFMVLASDGLWNVMSHQEVVEFVYKFRQDELKKKPARGSKVAHALIEEALQRWNAKRWSADNISVMIVFFLRMMKQQTSNSDEVPGPSLRGTRVPSSDSGLQSGSDSPDSKEDPSEDPDSPVHPYKPPSQETFYEETRDNEYGLIDMNNNITTTECSETSAPLLPEHLLEEFQIVNNGATCDSDVDCNDLECRSESCEKAIQKGKRKSTEMSEGHSCPIAVPCMSKRSKF